MNTTMLAAISGQSLLWAVVWVVVAGVVFYLVNWFIDYAKIGDPFAKVAKVIAALVALIFLINAIMSLAGRPFITW